MRLNKFHLSTEGRLRSNKLHVHNEVSQHLFKPENSPSLVTPGTNSAHLEVVVHIYYANLLEAWGSKWDIVSKIFSMRSQ